MKNIITSSYISVKNKAQTQEIVFNKSRFIGYAKHTLTQEEAIDFIKEVTNMHPEASCICHVYICGMKQEVQKLHDGHEPVGGMPILEILRLKKLTAVCCVVVRYYGGKKLGIGGLARAFSNTAAEAINLAIPCLYELSKKIDLIFDYQYKGKIDYMLSNSVYKTEKISFDSKVNIVISYKLSLEEEFISKISTITNRKHVINEIETFYECWD